MTEDEREEKRIEAIRSIGIAKVHLSYAVEHMEAAGLDPEPVREVLGRVSGIFERIRRGGQERLH